MTPTPKGTLNLPEERRTPLMRLCTCSHPVESHRRDWITNMKEGSKRRAFLCRKRIQDPTDPEESVMCDCFGFVKERVFK